MCEGFKPDAGGANPKVTTRCCASLAIKERLGDEHGAASAYYQLGSVTEERHDFDAAGVPDEWRLFAVERQTGRPPTCSAIE